MTASAYARRRAWALSGLVLLAIAVLAAAAGSARARTDGSPAQITVAVGTRPATMDPDLVTSITDVDAMNLIAGTLFRWQNNATVPDLASGVKTSANGLTQTFTLRPHLKFSDGTPLTAKDVAATLTRGKNDKSNGYGGLYKPIVSATATSPHTVVVKLTRPYPSLSTILTEPEFAVLPAKDLNPAKGTAVGKSLDLPVSAGRYKLQSWGGGPTEVFVSNPNYWGKKPSVGKVTFTTIPDFTARQNALRSGQVDMIISVPPSLIPATQQISGVRIGGTGLYGFSALFTNDLKPPLNNVNVRKAISLAIDRDRIARNVFYDKVHALAGFWPSTMDGYDPSISTKPNPDAAKKLLAGTPCAKGCTLQLIYALSDTPWAEQVAILIQDDLKKIGIKTNLVQLDGGDIIGKMFKSQYQIGVLGVYDTAHIPDGLMAYALQKDGGLNSIFSGYNSPKMNALMKTVIESTGAKRLKALEAMNGQFVKDQPYATLSDFPFFYATKLPDSVVTIGPDGYIDIS
jgi:ABC-type transport system substrate-binding protein